MIDYAADAAMLAELGKLTEAHPDLPDLVSRKFDEDGMHAVPWLNLSPLTALLRWIDVLPGEWAVRAEPAPGGEGTQLTARGSLAGRSLALTAVTWRLTPVSRKDSLIVREQLAHLAAEEVAAVAPQLTPEPAPAPA